MKTIKLFLLLFVSVSLPLLSQTSSYNFTSSSSTFTAITGGTVLGTISNDDEVFNNNISGETAPQTDIGFPIGFNFNYNGVIYDRFAVNTNGWILLGVGNFAIGGTYTPISNTVAAGFENIISALGRDLQGQTGSELSYLLTGNAPNRVMVVQWLNYRKFNAASGESYSFQIRLNESNYSIDFVYGIINTANTSTTAQNNPTQLGIRGLVNTDFKNRSTTTSWASSSAGTLNTSTMRLTTTVKPANGLKYSWTPSNMMYSSSTTLLADTSSIKKNTRNNPVLKIQVITTGFLNPLSVTNISLNTNGTSSINDISNARVWFTGTSPIFDSIYQFGFVVINPNGSFTISSTQQLSGGSNYFWLTYDVPSTAVTGNSIDGECTSITIGTAKTPTIQAPAGNRKVSSSPLNGTYAVGLALFNKLSGKQLKFKSVPVIINRDIYSKVSNDANIRSNTKEVSIEQNLNKSNIVTEKDSFFLVENNMPYLGSECLEVTTEMRNKFSNVINFDEINAVYPSISSAINDLDNRGIQGPVIFSLTDANYSSETFPIIIQNIAGTSISNTVTIKPAETVNPMITMTSGQVMFKIINASYIIIDGSNTTNGTTRNLSIISNDVNVSNGIWICSSGNRTSNYVTVKNCNIKAGENSLGSSPILISDGNISGNPGVFSNITLQNNYIQKGRQGIYVNGGINPQNGSNIYIYDNVINSTGINSTGYLGIYIQGVINSVIRGNEVSNLNNSSAEDDKAIWVANGSHNITVERNIVSNIGYSGNLGNGGHGIYVSANHLNADVTLKNNLIYNIYGDGWNYTDPSYFLDNPSAIVLYSSSLQSGINIFNNSVNLYGNTLKQSLALSSGIFITAGTTADIRNNSIINNLGNLIDSAYGSCGIFAQSSNSQFLNIDYNNYYVNPTGNGVKATGIISSTAFLNLSHWKSATNKDRSSLSYDPGYTNDSNLIPNISSSNCWSLNGRGTQIVSVNNDFAGNLRSTSLSAGAPDIGAFEFTPSSQPPLLIQTGSIADGSTLTFMFAGDTTAAITWHGSNLPASVTAKLFTGTNPPSAISGNFGNYYISFTPTGGISYTFDIKLFYDPSLIGTISNESKISLSNYTSSVWNHYSSDLNTLLRTVTKSGLTELTIFSIDDFDFPMPVKLITFTSSTNGRNVRLNWSTEMEINNSGFDIERKSDIESKWKKIGFIEGHGNSNETNEYSYTDNGLNTAIYNYRLKQKDYNGSFEYYFLNSEVVVGKPVNFDISQNFPNPSNPSSKINFQVPKDANVSIKIYNIEGKEVKTILDSYLAAGYYSANFDGSNVASGIYFYRIMTAGYTKTMKLILVK